MMEFFDLGALAHHLMKETVGGFHQAHDGLEKAAQLLEKEAKAEFGAYQSAIGPFAAWAELAESTKEDRASKGYSENDPLLRDGTLRDSIQHETEGLEAIVGSTDPIMEWQEFGTSKMPPRPVLGTAFYRNADKILKIIGHYSVSGIVGGDPIHHSLGYNIESGG
jgi:HK97 gp10 family phage protein